MNKFIIIAGIPEYLKGTKSKKKEVRKNNPKNFWVVFIGGIL
jgi:high-affinity K+ transport system ATPase subunit B